MDYEKISKAAEIISKKVLTPIIYMAEHEDWVEFICFCDGKITIREIYETEQLVKNEIGMDVEIIDIREFPELERPEIISEYSLIHSENPLIEKLFTASMMTDYQNLMDEKRSMLERKRECGTYFLM
ncbi:MAG: hypothetical protein LIO59_04695 [Oscillospiraceae bacterium]|nr:hypothetical protein [Oscillospiraceae bacterium]